MRFLRRFHWGPATNGTPFAQADRRPFPSCPPFRFAPGRMLVPGRMRSRFAGTRAVRTMANFYTEAMTWLALGSPCWVTVSARHNDALRNPGEGPLCSLNRRPDVSAGTAEPVKTYVGDLGLMCREAQTFQGASGGRTQVVKMLG